MAGSVYVIFFLLLNLDLNRFFGDMPVALAIPLGLLLLLVPLALGGALWGGLLARLAGRPTPPSAHTGAIWVLVVVAVFALPVHFSQVLPFRDSFPFGTHGAFTLIFMIEVAGVAGVGTSRLWRGLELRSDPNVVGRSAGVAAALGFLVGSALAALIGYRVGGGGMNMIWALHIGNLAAGLLAGWVTGLALDRDLVSPVGEVVA